MHRSVLHSKSFQRYFLTYAAIFAAMIFISILLLARTTNKERARAVIEAFCRRPDKTMIYVTHYERELPRCVDKKMVLQNHA